MIVIIIVWYGNGIGILVEESGYIFIYDVSDFGYCLLVYFRVVDVGVEFFIFFFGGFVLIGDYLMLYLFMLR